MHIQILQLPLLSIALSMASLLALAGRSSGEPPAQSAPPSLPAESPELKSIFDGNSLAGWDGDPRLWSAKDGVLRGETTAEHAAQGNTFLIWRGGTTADFELRLSFRCNATNNSGIQYRSRHATGEDLKNSWVLRGYQHELRNELKLPNVAGFIYGEGLPGRGRICLVGEQARMVDGKKEVTAQLIDNDDYRQLFHLDDWNEVVIIARQRRLQHWLNGRLILDFTDSPELALTDGLLGLQLHAGQPMWAEFKELRIRTLSTSDSP